MIGCCIEKMRRKNQIYEDARRIQERMAELLRDYETEMRTPEGQEKQREVMAKITGQCLEYSERLAEEQSKSATKLSVCRFVG